MLVETACRPRDCHIGTARRALELLDERVIDIVPSAASLANPGRLAVIGHVQIEARVDGLIDVSPRKAGGPERAGAITH